MITELSVSGFKSAIEEVRLPLSQITLISGANSAGKSSCIQPILLLKQTLETPYDPGDLNIAGPNVQFTKSEQLFSKILGGRRDEFRITLKSDEEEAITFSYKRQESGSIYLDAQTLCMKDGKSVTLQSDVSNQELEPIFKQLFGKSPFSALMKQQDVKYVLERNRCFFDLVARFKDGRFYVEHLGTSSSNIKQEAKSFLTNLIHVPGLRGNPDRVYQKSGLPTQFPGLFNDYVASLIHFWNTNSDKRFKKIGQNLEKLGLGWKVHTRQVDDTKVEVLISRLQKSIRGGAQDLVSIADVGFGVSQTLPVIASLLAAGKGQAVYIEQPEIHLHPKAQIALAEIIVEAKDRGVRIILETHSHLLLLAIQTMIAMGKILPNEVSLNWFSRRPTDGATVVDHAKIDELGTFGDWPVDFADIELRAHGDYMSAVEKRIMKDGK